MLALLVMLSLAQAPCGLTDKDCQNEVETIETEDLDQAILFLIEQDAKRRKAVARLPVCPVEPGRSWNLECA